MGCRKRRRAKPLLDFMNNASAVEIMQGLRRLHELEDKAADLGPKQELPSDEAALMAKLRATLPPMIIGHHDRMRQRGKRSVAEVKHNVCMACHMAVPVGVVQTLRRGEDIQVCGNCGRYLYLVEEVVAVVTEPPAAPSQPEPIKPPAKRKRRKGPPPA